jgi:hypothetical protein
MASYGYINAFSESVSAVTATPSVPLGTRRMENGNEYVYVYNIGVTAVVGRGMICSLNSGYSVTVSAALGNLAFGVVQNASLTTEAYGWLLTRGFGKVQMGDTATGNTTATTGQGFYIGANGAFEPLTTGATGSTWAYANAGFTVATINTGVSGSAYFKCIG